MYGSITVSVNKTAYHLKQMQCLYHNALYFVKQELSNVMRLLNHLYRIFRSISQSGENRSKMGILLYTRYASTPPIYI